MGVQTIQGEDGRNTGDVLPVAGSVAGSPFTVTGTSSPTPALTGLVIVSVQTNPIHVRFDGSAATANDMLLPVGIHRFPCDGEVMTMIQDSAAATVYVELAKAR